jgi:hypothetical protein
MVKQVSGAFEADHKAIKPLIEAAESSHYAMLQAKTDAAKASSAQKFQQDAQAVRDACAKLHGKIVA